jgi:hypothetical protein
MKPSPIHLITSRINRLSLPHQVAHLRVLVAQEKPFSVRRNELQSLLAGKLLRQLKIENRKNKVA